MKPYILLVQEDSNDIELTRQALAKNHIVNDLVVLRDGAAACDFLFTGAGEERALPQVILLDLNLPKVSGLEILERIRARARTQAIPTVILTSSKKEEDLLESYRRGTSRYVRKPVDFNEFVEAVRQTGLCWMVLNERP